MLRMEKINLEDFAVLLLKLVIFFIILSVACLLLYVTVGVFHLHSGTLTCEVLRQINVIGWFSAIILLFTWIFFIPAVIISRVLTKKR
jgi:hypothetical protein